MSKEKSRTVLRNSTVKSAAQGANPRVAAVLQALDRKEWSQSSLAVEAQLNRGVLNQLYKNQTGATAMLVGRLCAALSRKDAVKLLSAYLDDILDEVAEQEAEVRKPSSKDGLSVSLKVSFPPPPVAG